jgi:hypothetical protein
MAVKLRHVKLRLLIGPWTAASAVPLVHASCWGNVLTTAILGVSWGQAKPTCGTRYGEHLVTEGATTHGCSCLQLPTSSRDGCVLVMWKEYKQ